MSAPSQSFLFNETAGGSKSGQTLPIGPQTGAGSVSVVPAADLANLEPAATPITGASMPSGGIGLTGWLSAIWSKLSGTLAVSGTFWQATQPVSAASLPLPTGAATATLQSAAQSAPGTPQTVALTVQGNASGIAVPTVETYANISGVSPVSVGQSPTLIVAARAGRKEVTLILEAAVAVRIGGSSVASATNGALLQGVLGEAITISGGAAIYGYAPTGTASVSALEVY